MKSEEFAYEMPSHANGGGWLARATVFNLCLLTALIIPLLLLYYKSPAHQEEAERGKLAQLEVNRDALRGERAQLRQKLDLIQKDPDYLEVMARDRLQMQKDGEIILRFE